MSDFKQREERILKFWEDHNIFRKSVARREGEKPFVFFEGPPTANGSPGIHHFIGRVFKDIINRYQTMRGRYVLRKGGWDTHGLPVELQVEKELGFKNKKDIEAYGIAEFNRKCRQSVWRYQEEWERFTRRIGYWVDLDHPYVTYENPYMESLWSIIRRFWDRKLLYQAHRVVPFCTRCGTPLSSHEVAQEYRTVSDTSVYLKFKVKSSKLKVDGATSYKLPANTYILAWTTTPWTLPGNVALAVGPDIRYVLVQHDKEFFILAATVAERVLGAPPHIIAEFTGAQLVGIQYEPLFAVKALKKPGSYKVYEADFVTTTDGTGVVHTAVMYGEDDYRLGTALGLVKHHTVDEQGKFTGVSKDLDGLYVKSSTAERVILEHLRSTGLLLREEPYEHDYPFCWRCGTPLLYYAKDSWFVRMSSVNKELLANNETITWIPKHLKEGRFGQWLREGKDWAFSRERYWGTPLPIWSAQDRRGKLIGPPLVVSSLADLDTYRHRKPNTYWLVRHGQAQQNVDGIIDSGEGKFSLTELGRQQAQQAAATLREALRKKRRTFAAILSSPILRTKETADIIAKELGSAKITLEPRLEEIRLGALSGCHDARYHELYPTYESKFIQQPPGGESLTDLKARLWSLINELEETYEGKDILIVSHEYPLWMFTDIARGWTVAESIAEKERRGDDFVAFAQPETSIVRNLPRDEQGNVDLHRPYIDRIVLKHPGGRTPLYRVPELCDVWFDSGAMPYAQWHWPFEREAVFRQQFPADFISEGIDQTRGWFYTLLAIATALGDPAPYRAVLSFGHVLDEKGQKMSKTKGNIVKPDDVIAAVGVDAARWYFYTINDPGDSKLFSMKDVRERLTGFLMTLQNCVRFYELYTLHTPRSKSQVPGLLDAWILSRLAGVTATVTEHLDAYDMTTAARELERFVVDDMSQWWLRRSRKRADALGILRHILLQLSRLLAPFIPFTAEDLWQKLHDADAPPSVHLADWPTTDTQPDSSLEEQMKHVREFISTGLALRKEAQIKVRQPLASVTVPGARPLHGDLETLIKDELNVKEVRYDVGKPVALNTNIGPELRAEGYAREVMRQIQDMRKEIGLQMGDRAYCQWFSEDADITRALDTHADTISADTGLSAFVQQRDDKTLTVEKEVDLEPGKHLWLGVRKS